MNIFNEILLHLVTEDELARPNPLGYVQFCPFPPICIPAETARRLIAARDGLREGIARNMGHCIYSDGEPQ